MRMQKSYTDLVAARRAQRKRIEEIGRSEADGLGWRDKKQTRLERCCKGNGFFLNDCTEED
ncbi:uncharacterized protein PHALS_01073 [Plasmopara halstedii]|uniref:Uncharacterized protein n=1 Tax=Plasmopara halstedii TaxID=4781 RepID=A0A0P1ASB7_PLAHL|nr:uncharacterized protein PHALS_01073 [Plasmopara halstedii]CEG44733.1 hypothetical protein PHALS_01073 [Plasmopara halstedii]|eukprot:XP_024581102.1 hypothetical protein PHALS_01073 [Plasmopara halstedii]